MEWSKLKLKKRVDWYMDAGDYERYLSLAHKKGFKSFTIFIKSLLQTEWEIEQQVEKNLLDLRSRLENK